MEISLVYSFVLVWIDTDIFLGNSIDVTDSSLMVDKSSNILFFVSNYSGICVKGLAKCSWQNGSLPTVQISVSWNSKVLAKEDTKYCESLTYRLKVLALFSIETSSLESNDFWCGIRVVSNGRAALWAEETVNGIARRALATPFLDRTVDSQFVLGNNNDKS